MERLKDYECPRECVLRSLSCHSECARHRKYREIAEEIRVQKYTSRQKDNLMGNRAFAKKK